MIVAEWLGGPHDGAQQALPSAHTPVALARPPDLSLLEQAMRNPGEPVELDADRIVIKPRLTKNGWRLDWPKGL